MSPLGKTGLLIGIIVIGMVCALELWHWFRGDSLLTRAQLVRRLVVGVLLQVAMAMALVGEALTRALPAAYQMAYWGVCMVLVFLPLLIALREITFVSRQYAQRR